MARKNMDDQKSKRAAKEPLDQQVRMRSAPRVM
jgi:hypothetical protein